MEEDELDELDEEESDEDEEGIEAVKYIWRKMTLNKLFKIRNWI